MDISFSPHGSHLRCFTYSTSSVESSETKTSTAVWMRSHNGSLASCAQYRLILRYTLSTETYCDTRHRPTGLDVHKKVRSFLYFADHLVKVGQKPACDSSRTMLAPDPFEMLHHNLCYGGRNNWHFAKWDKFLSQTACSNSPLPWWCDRWLQATSGFWSTLNFQRCTNMSSHQAFGCWLACGSCSVIPMLGFWNSSKDITMEKLQSLPRFYASPTLVMVTWWQKHWFIPELAVTFLLPCIWGSSAKASTRQIRSNATHQIFVLLWPKWLGYVFRRIALMLSPPTRTTTSRQSLMPYKMATRRWRMPPMTAMRRTFTQNVVEMAKLSPVVEHGPSQRSQPLFPHVIVVICFSTRGVPICKIRNLMQ